MKMKKVHGKPITGSKSNMKASAPFKTEDTKVTEKQLKRAPEPFANKFGIVKLPTKRGHAAVAKKGKKVKRSAFYGN